MNYHFGMLIGLTLGMAAGFAVVALLVKKKVLDMHFDERQELARGKAFQYGFFTLLIAAYVYGLSDVLLGRWCDVLTGVTLCIALAICVFAITCILKDAYLSLREKPRTIMTFFALLSIINLGFGVMYHISPGLTENGVLTFRAVNPIIGFATLIILVVYVVNYLLSPRDEEAE
ncbi:MAG: hypothetical protein OSJ58_04690 [Dysosmobacter sp.]|nr:hypothetical protein [Dysosmobacter sp.]